MKPTRRYAARAGALKSLTYSDTSGAIERDASTTTAAMPGAARPWPRDRGRTHTPCTWHTCYHFDTHNVACAHCEAERTRRRTAGGEEVRDKVLGVALSEREWAQVDAAARRASQYAATWARDALLKAAATPEAPR